MHEIIDLLAYQPLFSRLDAATRAEIAEEATLISIPGGWTLFNQGDEAEALYVVLSGTLGVIRKNDRSQLSARIHVGETAGEMAVISNDRRSNTVIALRDSTLLRIEKPIFENLLLRHSHAMLHLMRILADRLRKITDDLDPPNTANTYAVLPLTEGVDTAVIGGRLIGALMDLRRDPNSRMIFLDGSEPNLDETALHTIEADHRHVIYVSDDPGSGWGGVCRRRADHILLVAVPGAPILPTAEKFIGNRHEWRRRDLVLLRRDGVPAPPGDFAERFSCEFVLRLDLVNAPDMQRLARIITRRAVGVAFSGGGARGFAHVGVVKALRECGIPIDMFAGTSMGGIVAACFAMGWNVEEVTEQLRETFVGSSPTGDFTFPSVALTRGEKVSARLYKTFGETRIVDLELPYFCVSSDLTEGKLHIHNSGKLWEALRASVAIPGLMPPKILNGRILADGGLINNLPANVMAGLNRGPVVAVEVGQNMSAMFTPDKPKYAGLLRSLSGADPRIPGIVPILIRSGTLSSEERLAALPEHAAVIFRPPLEQIDLLDWQKLEQCIDLGYRHALEQIESGALDPLGISGEPS